jgi:hypothetical protein
MMQDTYVGWAKTPTVHFVLTGSTRRLYTSTYLLFPAVHCLLEILPRLEDQKVDNVQIGNVPVSLEVRPLLSSDTGRRDVESIKRNDLWSLK